MEETLKNYLCHFQNFSFFCLMIIIWNSVENVTFIQTAQASFYTQEKMKKKDCFECVIQFSCEYQVRQDLVCVWE